MNYKGEKSRILNSEILESLIFMYQFLSQKQKVLSRFIFRLIILFKMDSCLYLHFSNGSKDQSSTSEGKFALNDILCHSDGLDKAIARVENMAHPKRLHQAPSGSIRLHQAPSGSIT